MKNPAPHACESIYTRQKKKGKRRKHYESDK